ncbi:MAG: hypothetical protein ACTSYF_05030 [Promethearchaeota archaeon]
MTIPANIIHSGNPKPLPHACKYEKTTSNDEVVAGRVLMRGSSDSQLKLNDGSGDPIAVANRQVGNLGYNSTTGKYDSSMAHDGETIDNFAWGFFIWYGCLADGQTITMGDSLMALASGKLGATTTGKRQCAIAMESASPNGDDKDDFLALWTGNMYGLP